MRESTTAYMPDHLISKARAEEINTSFSENALKMMRKRYLRTKEDGSQEAPAEMFHRIAHALAHVEEKYGRNGEFIDSLEKDFFDLMANKKYTPAGRTVTNTGASTAIVANCIVLPINDNMKSIFQTLKDAALLQQAGSGLGFDFSDLRPAMTKTKRSNGVSSGPVSFLQVYNEAFGIIKQQGRHGANMAMMQVDHPDVLDFMRAKKVEGSIRNFNISIKVTDEFMRAVIEHPNEQWYCTWRGEKTKPHKVIRATNGSVVGAEDIDITAKQIFDELVLNAWTNGEPGIVFIDEVNRTNPLPGLGKIGTSNPCGEQFLHPYDNCNLGSLNLAAFVRHGKKSASFDWVGLKAGTKLATRLMDNVIDLFDFPVPQVTELAQKNRRVGLGIMGFADTLYALNIPYNSEAGRAMGERLMKTVTDTAHAMSRELAAEKGAFPNIALSVYAKKKPVRNAALTTVAPTGSISMMFDCSSGIEPNFALYYIKQDKDGHQYPYFNTYFKEALMRRKLSHEALAEVEREVMQKGSIQNITSLPQEFRDTFTVAMDISADDHMAMQSAFQQHVDNSISKTINFPSSATHEDVARGFITAWKSKCKSATVYRDGSRHVQILNLGASEIISPTEVAGKKEDKETALAVDQTRLEPRTRPDVMAGNTYRIKTGYGNLYITINNDEQGAPFEIFATIGKTGGFYQEQSEAICRLVSLALRTGTKVENVIDNLKGIRGPMPVITNRGTVLSLPDAIGRILEEHVKQNDDMRRTMKLEEAVSTMAHIASEEAPRANLASAKRDMADFGMMPGCPDCGGPLQMGEGCMSCKSCGFSRCM